MREVFLIRKGFFHQRKHAITELFRKASCFPAVLFFMLFQDRQVPLAGIHHTVLNKNARGKTNMVLRGHLLSGIIWTKELLFVSLPSAFSKRRSHGKETEEKRQK